MITFNNIVERFEVFATNHFFIKSFSFGSPDDVDLAKFTEFPLMHMVYTGATYDTGTKTYNIEVYILDVPADKTDKVERQREVVSDAEQCAEDIIADIRMGGNIFTFAQDYEVVNATTTPLEEETKNVLSGVLLDLSVEIPYEWDACNAPIDGVIPGGGDVPSYARRGFLRMLTLDGTTDVLSVRTINVTNGTLTDDGDGVVTLNTGGAETLEDLTDVNIISPEQGDVLSYNSGVQKWMKNGGLQELLARFKASGSGAQMYDTLNDTTKGYIDILAASAKMKVNHSGLTVTEASPGVMSFAVAAGTEGNEVEFEAMTIEGSDAISTIADINFKQGSLTYWENATGKIWLRAPNAGNITVLLPSSTGTLALTTDIPNVPVDSVNGQTGVVVLDTGDIDENGNLYYTEARVAANSAVAANTAKVGITTQQAADITANNAKVGITPTQAGEITANTAKVGVIAGGTSGQALVKASGTDYDTEWADIAIDTQYHNRFQTDAETFRSGATDTVELYYTAKADGDGLAESASSDTPTAGKIIRRKIYYSEAAFADPDTGTWVEFTPAPADDASFATVKAALLEYLKARTGGTVPISLKQTWEEVTAAPTFTGLLNETYGSGAAAAYGTRRLNGNYSGACMTIRRASDGTTQTIGFVGEEINESAITNFCTGSTCTVQVWHDQSQTGGTGSGNDATQTTPANQPTIYTGGQLVKDGGRVALTSTGNTSFDFTQITDINSVFSVLRPTNFTGNSDSFILGDISNYNYHSGGSNNSGKWLHDSYSAPVVRNGDNYLNGTSVNLTTLMRSAGQYVLSMIHTANTAVASTISQDRTIAGRSWIGNRQELIIYSDDRTNDRTDIEGNISAYYQSAKLLDEQFGSGAEAAYSVRQLKRDNTECMVIRRASDSTTTTIGFDGSGNIDEAAIETFCTGTTCTVSEWKDQSSNGNHATQSTPANEPIIYQSGNIEKLNGRAVVNFNGDALWGGYLSNEIQTLFIAFKPAASGSRWLYDFDTVGAAQIKESGALGFTDYVDGNDYGGDFGSVDNLPRVLLRGESFDAQTTPMMKISDRNAGDTTSNPGQQKAHEIIAFNAVKSGADVTSIESNVGDYFTQNTPLLDTYTGAAAAYSLRKLSSSYSGSAIRVRRSSDNTEQDINFNVFGELDTVSLLAFAGTDAFVKVWYDQSSNGVDVTQTNTGKQPQIVSSGTVIVEANGKPAIKFDGSNDVLTNANGWTQGSSRNDFNVLSSDGTAAGVWNTDFTPRFAHNLRCDSMKFGTLSFTSSNVVVAVSEPNASTINTSYLVTGEYDLTNTALSLYKNGSLEVTTSMVNQRTGTGGDVSIGTSYQSTSGYFGGKIQEIVSYQTRKADDRADIESNINLFYNIY